MQNSPELWRASYPVLKRDGHKYDRGHALIYGGEVMTGAARLAAQAAQRMGAGLVTLATTAKALPIYATALESVIVREADDVKAWQELLAEPKRNAVLVGPGLGAGALQKELVLAALETRKPCVLDADALTGFADQPEVLLSKLHDQCVLTPHEGEFAKLFGNILTSFPRKRESSASNSEHVSHGPHGHAALDSRFRGNDVEGLELKRDRALAAAKLAGCVVLLKGADTIIAAPDGNYILNNNAPPWLATAGAGDVLAGLILGLVVQKMPVFPAAAAAAWVHGETATRLGSGLIAEDLVDGVRFTVQKLLADKPS